MFSLGAPELNLISNSQKLPLLRVDIETVYIRKHDPETFSDMCPPKYVETVKPRFMDTHLIRTPHYYGQFALFLGTVSRTFSLNSTRLLRTPR